MTDQEIEFLQILSERPELTKYATYLISTFLSDPDAEPIDYEAWKEAGEDVA